MMSRDGSVTVDTRLWFGWLGFGYGQKKWLDYFVPLHCIQTASGAHPASYTMCIVGSIPGGEETGTWRQGRAME